MIRLVLAGLWVCILTAGTSYAVAYWKENGSLLPAKDEYLDGLQYQKTRALSVPMRELCDLIACSVIAIQGPA